MTLRLKLIAHSTKRNESDLLIMKRVWATAYRRPHSLGVQPIPHHYDASKSYNPREE